MAAIVERDDPAAVFLQLRDPGRIDPVDVFGRGKAVHQHDRIALAFVEIGNFDIAVMEVRHWHFRIWGEDRSAKAYASLTRLPLPWRPQQLPWQLPWQFLWRPPSAGATAAPSCGRARPGSPARWWT